MEGSCSLNEDGCDPIHPVTGNPVPGGNGGGGGEEDEDTIDNGNGDNNSKIIDIPNWLDEWLWDNIPSAYGIHFGASGQVGAFIEAGITPFEILALFNWRTGQLTLFYSGEAFGYIGTPNLIGGNVYGGYTSVKGLSDNKYFEGPSLFGGLTASLDEVIKGGGMLISGRGLDPDHTTELPPVFFIDPGSGRPFEYHQVSLTLGGNLIPNAADVGLIAGNSNSYGVMSVTIPNWPDLR